MTVYQGIFAAPEPEACKQDTESGTSPSYAESISARPDAWSGLAQIRCARFHHVAIAAPRMRDLLPLYVDAMGGEFYLGGDNVRGGFRLVHLKFADSSMIELLEPLAGSDFFKSFFRKHPDGGVHHLTFKVASLDASIEEAAKSGFSIFGVRKDRPEWHEAFIHPRLASGVLIQIVQSKERPPAHGYTIEDVLNGHGREGNGIKSP
jgi:methylmalonyl-CoA/ethylmalonyl-CoA epimerase